MLSKLCTCGGHLIPGTVCSPVISNFVFLECDKALHQIAIDHNCFYSRYVDDITFSGDKTPGLRMIDSTLAMFGFSRNIDKTYLQTRGKRQYVTGLTVFDNTIPRIPRQLKKKFRSDIYYMRMHGITGHLKMINSIESVNDVILRMDGLFSFYRSIEPHFASKYDDDWDKILEDNFKEKTEQGINNR